jgi:hypothetical protein
MVVVVALTVLKLLTIVLIEYQSFGPYSPWLYLYVFPCLNPPHRVGVNGTARVILTPETSMLGLGEPWMAIEWWIYTG